MKRLEFTKELLTQHIDLFRCPKCKDKMNLRVNSLICPKGHCFDLSKKGYVHFLLNPIQVEYDKALFESRKRICNLGLFTPMVEKVAEVIEKFFAVQDSLYLMDVGCGEGSHIVNLIGRLQPKFAATLGVGFDVSKDGIQIAASDHPELIWSVANLANVPFSDKKFDVILNIMSPTNHLEFYRTLKDDGLVIKVVQGSHYLKELRHIYYNGQDLRIPSDENMIKNFQAHFELLETQHIHYDFSLEDQDSIHDLVAMTPFSWKAPQENIQKALQLDQLSVTLDFTLLVGRKK